MSEIGYTNAATLAKLEGLYKEAYADNIQNLIPESAKLVKLVPFVSSTKEQGGKFHQPVVLQMEHGVTYASSSDGAFALLDPISMVMKDAQVDGSCQVVRASMSYVAASRASNSKKAFVKSTELIFTNLLESATKRVEIASFYGQVGIGKVISTYTTNVVVGIEVGHWAPGIFAGMEGCPIEFWEPTGATAAASTTIVSVNNDNKTITVAASTSIAAGQLIFFKGAVKNLDGTPAYNEMAGIQKILANTGSLFNISAATYNLWKGNTIAYTTGPLSIARILSGVSKCVARGLDEDVTVFVGSDTWQNLASDLGALRRFDGSYNSKKGEAGVEALTYHSQNGLINIVSHNIVKDGDCFILPLDRVKRIGSQDIGFTNPGRGEEIFMTMPSNAGYEIRCFSDQAIFIETPARAAYLYGFINS